MRARLLVMVPIVFGCDSTPAQRDHDDAGPSHPPADAFVECTYRPPENELCANTCGNGTLDACYVPMMVSSHCTVYYPKQEMCDGAAPVGASCDGLGYYGGTAGCNATCDGPDVSQCGVCAPGITCVTPVYGGSPMAVSGTHIATLGTNHIQFFSNTTPATSVAKQASSIAATAAGWLVGDGSVFQTLAFDGTLGPSVPMPTPGMRIHVGPGDRLTAVGTNNLMTEVRLVDQTGMSVTSAVAVFTATTRFGVATDGTHAFVGGVGSLATIALDGTSTTVAGFPSGDAVAVTWAGTTGWYVTATTAQRFDANGGLVGLAIALPHAAYQAIGDGDDLVAVIDLAGKIAVQRIYADGTTGTPVEVGAGSTQPTPARLGATLLIGWGLPWESVLAVLADPVPEHIDHGLARGRL